MNKAKMSRSLTTLIIITLFLSYPFDVSYGNFIPTSPDTIPPIISVISPTNKTYENKVLLHLNITAVAYQQWIDHVAYALDEQDHLVYSGEIKDLNWSTILEGLSEGTHSLKVAASCKSYYATPTSGGRLLYRTYWSHSEAINFTVVYPPEISILSLENKTYKTNKIPLNFTINEPVSKIEFSLDGQVNRIIAGNATLTGLSDGLHNVTIFATDVDGYVGISETTCFIIDTFPLSLVIASVVIIIAGLGIFSYRIKTNRRT